VGTTIIGAAVIDDILGIVILTLLSSLTDNTVKISVSLGRIALFFVFLSLFGTVVHYFFQWLDNRHGPKRRVAVYALSFCLFMAYAATRWFDVADIAGAYFAGIFLCNITRIRGYVADKITISSYMLFSPVFFASIGLQTNIKGLSAEIVIFSLILLVIAILTKIIGCGLGAKLFRFSNRDSLSIGVGMVTRGEVALVVAQKGALVGLISETLFPAIILIVVITSLLTPIMLKFVMGSNKTPPDNHDTDDPVTLEEGNLIFPELK
ncbi:MAG: cation:proton antiporter, partial [Clostridiales bacterium]|nr:cation:proton antiporter [Clostridiales bacterium]